MRNVTLFIAMSLDGYIAKPDGSVDWLQGQQAGKDDTQSYDMFIKDIDTVVMGWNTYHQLKTELSVDTWYYEDLDSYVFTHRKLNDTQNIHFINEDICDWIKAKKQEEGNGIWICGGAGVIQPLIEEHLIDTYYISIIPTILGSGIRLFQNRKEELLLELVETKSYNGITDLVYRPR